MRTISIAITLGVLIFSPKGNIYAQSKKDEISILKYKIDSVKILLNEQNELFSVENSKWNTLLTQEKEKKEKNDQLLAEKSKDLEQIKSEIELVKNQQVTKELEIRTLLERVSPRQTIVTDIDGNKYAAAKLGRLYWMAEDLRTTRYNNGDKIEKISSQDISTFYKGIEWDMDDPEQYFELGGAYIDMKDEESEVNKVIARETPIFYYNYFVAGHKNVCPDNWHVPSVDEVKDLMYFLNRYKKINEDEIMELGRSNFVGLLLMDTTANWTITDGFPKRYSSFMLKYPFNAEPTGIINERGAVLKLGEISSFWTITNYNHSNKFCPSVTNGFHFEINGHDATKKSFMPIRCVKD
jgi:uncharacterized protein (TIGR02145 family)